MSNTFLVRIKAEGGPAAASSIGAVGGALDKASASAGKAATSLDKTTRSVEETSKASQAAAASVRNLGSALLAAFSVREGVAAYLAASRTSIELAKLDTTLKFASASADEYAKNSAFLSQTVQALGLDLKSAGAAFASLSASAKGTTLEGEGARAIFDAVAKAATALGLSADQTEGSLLAIQQMISKGTVSAEELRGQLGERLPGAFQIAARAMGVTTQELGKMLEQGEVITDDFLPKFASQLRREMGGAAKEAADSVQANLNRMGTAWAELQQTVVNSSFNNESLKGLTEVISSMSGVLKQSSTDFRGWGGVVGEILAAAGDIALTVGSTIKQLGLDIAWMAARAKNALQTGSEVGRGSIMTREGVAARAAAQRAGAARAAAIDAARAEGLRPDVRTDFTQELMRRRQLADQQQQAMRRGSAADPGGSFSAAEAARLGRYPPPATATGGTRPPRAPNTRAPAAFVGTAANVPRDVSSFRQFEAAQYEATNDALRDRIRLQDEASREAAARTAEEAQALEALFDLETRNNEIRAASMDQMANAHRQAMENIVANGEDAWVRFATTGKLSVKGLIDGVLADLARLQFRQLIEGQLRSAGSAVLGALGLPAPGDSGGATLTAAGVTLTTAGGTLVTAAAALTSAAASLAASGASNAASTAASLFGFASGGAFGSGEVLSRPTMFRFMQGGQYRMGVAGEAGPEAALPLRNGGVVASVNGRRAGSLPLRRSGGILGVDLGRGFASGGAFGNVGGMAGGGGIVVNQTLVFQGNGVQRGEMAEFAKRVQQSTVAEIYDRERRGGRR